MDNLPDPATLGNNTNPTNTTNPTNKGGIQSGEVGPLAIGSLSKEVETGSIGYNSGETHGLQEVGGEIEISRDIERAGVKVHPTQIPVPQKLAAAGVQPAGDNVAVGSGNTVTLPLTDEQIAQGLKQDVSSSWRWLAQWCVRKLKQIHKVLIDRSKH